MLYVHIPYCRRKCLYCDFYSEGSLRADWPLLVDTLLAEAESRREEIVRAKDPATIYIGGGTPSLLPPEEFSRLADGLLSLTGEVEEFTIEVNPDDVTRELAALWRSCGVDRVSMGVQSLVDEELRSVGRRHDSRTATESYEVLRHEIGNVSLDLIFGLPGQTCASLASTLRGFLDMRPDHISAYSLMYEERAALTRLRDAGKISETPEEDSAEMFALLCGTLGEAGYEQYEISNYALPGRRSVHNSGYWRGCAYVGLGPGAHSYDGRGWRRANLPDLKAYLAGERKMAEETLTRAELIEEYIMTRLRTREGIDLADFALRFGEAVRSALLRSAHPALHAGNLELIGNRLALTRLGIMISDDIITDLFP